MQAEFTSQPFDDGSSLFDFIDEVSADTTVQRFDVVVAWVKRSGLRRVRDQLLAMRSRGVELRIIIGIDQGGATAQGLDMAKEIFTDVYVFHDRSGRTFHSKVYFAVGADAASALVGSHNLTAGGVYFNYEAGVRLALTSPEDDETIDSLIEYFERLRSDDACIHLSAELLDELKGNPRYRVADEDAGRKVSSDGDAVDVDSEVDLEGDAGTLPAESIFAKSAIAKAPPPPIPPADEPNGGGAKKATAKKAAVAKKTVAKKTAATQTGGTVLRRWFKELPASDAQRPQTGNPTGALRLTKAKHPINWQTYFRYDFFGDEQWQASVSGNGQPIEYVNVSFEARVGDKLIGNRSLRVDHAPHREQGQGNVPTDLKWGSLAPELQQVDVEGWYVILEKLSDGSYRLEIAPDAPPAEAFIN